MCGKSAQLFGGVARLGGAENICALGPHICAEGRHICFFRAHICAEVPDNCAGFPDNCLPGWYRVPPGGRAWGRVPSGGVGLSSMWAGLQEEEPGSPELLPGSPEELLVPPEPLPLAGRIFSRIWRSCLARLVFLPRPPVMKSMRLEKPS